MKIKLVVVQGRPQGKVLTFPIGEYMIGRGAECYIRPNSEWVSRQHCMLRVTAEGMFVRDLGSRNGTLVNGVRLVGEQRLAHGDQLQVSPLAFEVCLHAPGDDKVTQEETQNFLTDTAELPMMEQVGGSGLAETETTRSHDSLLIPPPT